LIYRDFVVCVVGRICGARVLEVGIVLVVWSEAEVSYLWWVS
jgi:hypothetical protein